MQSRRRPANSAASAVAKPRGAGDARLVLKRAIIVLGWCASLGGAAYGLWSADAFSRQALATREPKVEWVGVPPWLTEPGWEYVLSAAHRAADDQVSAGLLDPNLCENISQAVASLPWVHSVQRVTRQGDGLIRVQAVFRHPAAVVVHKNRAYPIDDAGVRLTLPPAPRRDDEQELKPEQVDTGDYFVIVGVRKAPPAPGQAWTGDDVAAGRRLVEFLVESGVARTHPLRGSLKAIDVSTFDGSARGYLQIQTIHEKSPIVWGLPPGEEYDIEPAAKRKLETLVTIFNAAGAIPDTGPHDLRYADRFWRPKPDTPTPEATKPAGKR